MTLSLAALSALYAESTGEALVPLITLTVEGWPTIRLAGWHESIVSRGQTYEAFPIVELVLPGWSVDQPPEPGRLVVANVARELVPALRSTTAPMRVDVEIVRPSAPDVVEVALAGLDVVAEEITAAAITAPLVVRDPWTLKYPAETFSPALFPGLSP